MCACHPKRSKFFEWQASSDLWRCGLLLCIAQRNLRSGAESKQFCPQSQIAFSDLPYTVPLCLYGQLQLNVELSPHYLFTASTLDAHSRMLSCFFFFFIPFIIYYRPVMWLTGCRVQPVMVVLCCIWQGYIKHKYSVQTYGPVRCTRVYNTDVYTCTVAHSYSCQWQAIRYTWAAQAEENAVCKSPLFSPGSEWSSMMCV